MLPVSSSLLGLRYPEDLMVRSSMSPSSSLCVSVLGCELSAFALSDDYSLSRRSDDNELEDSCKEISPRSSVALYFDELAANGKRRRSVSFLKTLKQLAGLSERPPDSGSQSEEATATTHVHEYKCEECGDSVDDCQCTVRGPVVFGRRGDYHTYYSRLLDECGADLPDSLVALICYMMSFELLELVLVQDTARGGLWNVGQIVDLRMPAIGGVAADQKPICKVHCIGWSQVFSEWLTLDSPRLKPIKPYFEPQLSVLAKDIASFRLYDLRSYIFYKVLTSGSLHESWKRLGPVSASSLPVDVLLAIGAMADELCRNTLDARHSFLHSERQRQRQDADASSLSSPLLAESRRPTVTETIEMLRGVALLSEDDSEFGCEKPTIGALLSETQLSEVLSLLYRLLAKDQSSRRRRRNGRRQSVLKKDVVSIQECWLLRGESEVSLKIHRVVDILEGRFTAKFKSKSSGNH